MACTNEEELNEWKNFQVIHYHNRTNKSNGLDDISRKSRFQVDFNPRKFSKLNEFNFNG